MDRLTRKLNELQPQVNGLVDLTLAPSPMPYRQFIRKAMQRRLSFVKDLVVDLETRLDVNIDELERVDKQIDVLADTLADWAGSDSTLCFDSRLDEDEDEDEDDEEYYSEEDIVSPETRDVDEETKASAPNERKEAKRCGLFGKMALFVAYVAIVVTCWRMNDVPFFAAS